ncbi:MAG: phytanoyl-CoA dioxygenase family protein [Candidatus Latescibacteria bacterium]|nr:phytanoyl-CoA dioxygenase family protein [Candidatus Latescibacterota bacterium]
MYLTDQQISHFEEEGYVVVKDALSDGDLDPIIEEYTEHIDTRARRLGAEGKLSRLYEEEPFGKRLASITAETTEIYQDVDIMHFRGEATFNFLRNSHLIDPIESLVGPEITCSPIQHTRAKLPNKIIYQGIEAGGEEKFKQFLSENVAPWHQDAQVHLEEADSTFILTVWLPLTDATLENGCLHIIPHIHTRDRVYWSEGFGISEAHLPDEEGVVPLPMKKGDLLLMHKLTPHCSTLNKTGGIRWSMDLRYQKTGTPTGRAFWPDFTVRSRSNPASVLTDYVSWQQCWIEALGKMPTDKRPGRKSRPDILSCLICA